MKKYLMLILFIIVSGSIVQSQTLAERLGYKKTDRLLIINNDDAGMSHASNMGTIEGMEKGCISTSTIMTPCPWINEIIKYAINNPKRDFGAHLTLTSEWENYRWGTVAPRDKVPGLYDSQGYMWKEPEDVYKASSPQEALIEGRAQINKLIKRGVKITHIDSHMGTYQESPEYMKIYLQLAEEFNLPARMPSQATLDSFKQPLFRQMCKDKGIICPDYFIYEEFKNYTTENVDSFWVNYIKNIKPGVTEIYIHGSTESAEIHALSHIADRRVKELNFITSNTLKDLLKKEGIILIGYRPLMELQRKERQQKHR